MSAHTSAMWLYPRSSNCVDLEAISVSPLQAFSRMIRRLAGYLSGALIASFLDISTMNGRGACPPHLHDDQSRAVCCRYSPAPACTTSVAFCLSGEWTTNQP